jgi:hypothetical protein
VDYYTHYFLDHDLAAHHYESADPEQEKNGSMFAEWMAENEVKADVIVCHSMNPYGRMNMRNILLSRVSEKVHNAPFGWQRPERFI